MVAAAAVLSSFFTYRLLATNYSFMEAIMLSQREMTQAMVAELHTMRNERNSTDDTAPSWQPLSVRLVDEDGHPIEGTVRCTGTPFGKDNPIEQQVQTDATGVAKFGPLPAGPYSVTAAVKATSEEGGRTDILIGPGRRGDLTIRCPTKYGASVPVTGKIDVPDDISSDRLYFVVQLKRLGRTVDGAFWQFYGKPQTIWLLLNARGEVLGALPDELVDESAYRNSPMKRNFQFDNEISATLPLSLVRSIAPSRYEVSFAVYGAEPLTDKVTARPTLHLLAGGRNAERNINHESVEAFECTAQEGYVWENVRQGFARLEITSTNSTSLEAKVQESETPRDVGNSDSEREAAPTLPTATPPDNSDPD